MAAPESLSERPCIVLSAHLGDAAFSCGYLLSQLAPETPVTVMTLFTHAPTRPTRTARAYLKARNARQAPMLYNQRRVEDIMALRAIQVTGVHFGLADALFRQRENSSIPRVARGLVPELGAVYPTYGHHIATGKVSPHDRQLVADLEQRVLLTTSKDDVILAPIGLGRHVDRVIAHQVGKALSRNRTVGFYADQPVAQSLEGEIAAPQGTRQLKFDVDQNAKAALVERYNTHSRAILGKRVPTLDETVFLPESLF